MAVMTNCQGFSALVTHDSLPFIASRQQLHAANLVHLQLFMPFAAQLANPSPKAGCHVGVTLKDDLARLEVHFLPCRGLFLPEAAVIEKPLINSPARLAASLLGSAARENLDLAPLNLRFSRLHLTKNMLAIRPTHLIRVSLMISEQRERDSR